MLQSAENPQETLTNNVWDKWKSAGYTERPNTLTWLEVNNLTAHFLKTCREKGLDYQSFDYQNLLDNHLNYYENQSAITEAIGGPLESEEEYKAHMAKVAGEAQEEIQTAEQLAERNSDLEKQNKKLKAKEAETINTQELKAEMKQINETQAAILNKLEQLPNLANQVEALKRSKNFGNLGAALSPVIPQKNMPTRTLSDGPNGSAHYTPHGNGVEYCQHCGVKLDADAVKCWNCGAPIKEEKKPLFRIPECLKPKHHAGILDGFAGIMTIIIWVAATGWMLSSYAISWALIIGLAVFWLFFVVVFRLVIGGILD